MSKFYVLPEGSYTTNEFNGAYAYSEITPPPEPRRSINLDYVISAVIDGKSLYLTVDSKTMTHPGDEGYGLESEYENLCLHITDEKIIEDLKPKFNL